MIVPWRVLKIFIHKYIYISIYFLYIIYIWLGLLFYFFGWEIHKTTVATEHGCSEDGFMQHLLSDPKRQLTEAQQRAEPCFDTVFLHQLLRCVTKKNWRNGIPTVVAARGVRHVYWLSDVRAVCDLCPGPLCDDAVQKAELRR